MKARIKDTGEIVEVYPDTIAGFLADNSNYYKNEELSTELDDWQSFRREAAKDILCALVSDGRTTVNGASVTASIKLADELIKQLREERK